jgi:hypothetical protein
MNGDKHVDAKHHIKTLRPDITAGRSAWVVAATGTNEFGAFVSIGEYTPPAATGVKATLTIARRFARRTALDLARLLRVA